MKERVANLLKGICALPPFPVVLVTAVILPPAPTDLEACRASSSAHPAWRVELDLGAHAGIAYERAGSCELGVPAKAFCHY
jgi:hypothetical protein